MSNKRLHFTEGKSERYIPIDDIIFVQSEGNYCDFILRNNIKESAVRTTLGNVEKLIEELGTFADHNLIAISRNVIVNTKYITRVIAHGKKPKPRLPQITITYDNGTEKVIEASKPRFAKYQKTLDKANREILIKSAGLMYQLAVPLDELNNSHPYHNEHEYVDLGLPSKTMWASHNIGANDPNQSGDEFDFFCEDSTIAEEWCEYSGIDDESPILPVNLSQMKQSQETTPLTHLRELSADYIDSHDIAYNKWGGKWLLPSIDDFKELQEHCKLSWCRVNNKSGTLVTGPNGNSIFLPVAENKSIAQYWTIHPDRSDEYWFDFLEMQKDSIEFSEKADSQGLADISFCHSSSKSQLLVRPIFYTTKEYTAKELYNEEHKWD